MKHFTRIFALSILIAFLSVSVKFAQQDKPKAGEENKNVHIFTMDTQVKTTPVKNQARTGTCWCFATVSFLETELLRMGKGEFDLSEMYLIRNNYPLKAENYVRYQAMANYGEGGQAHDVFNLISKYGIAPEEAYSGRNNGEEKHNHSEMKNVTKGMLDAFVANKAGKLTPKWMDAYQSVLDVYLGKPPVEFTYKGTKYSPKSFYQSLGINQDDYIEITSYSHHPFYEKFRLEIPDNWTGQDYYNVPMNELEAIIDYALKNGYSVVWDGDVSEHEFSQKNGYAVIPLKDWDDKTPSEKEEKITKPEAEKTITQELRQLTFNNLTTTDDHLMHITGIAHDQNNTKFYYTKNSWGTEQTNGGYIYLSEPYVKLKTVAIMVHKNAVPREIAQKMKL
ncbi:MAG: aminopeptidase C [Bacillota bacterium]